MNDPYGINYTKFPEHIAIQIDGNRRWSHKNNVSFFEAYMEGFERIGEIISYCCDIKIKYLTLQILSDKTFVRPDKCSTNAILALTTKLIISPSWITHKAWRNAIRCAKIITIGNIDKLPQKLRIMFRTLMILTKRNIGTEVDILVSTGTDNLLDAINNLRYKNHITIDSLKSELPTGHLPKVDFYLRTGASDHILDDFLLLEIVNSSIYFTDVLWPDFTPKILEKTINKHLIGRKRGQTERGKQNLCDFVATV